MEQSILLYPQSSTQPDLAPFSYKHSLPTVGQATPERHG